MIRFGINAGIAFACIEISSMLGMDPRWTMPTLELGVAILSQAMRGSSNNQREQLPLYETPAP